MNLSELFRWAILVAIVVSMAFFVFMAYTTHDEMAKATYIAMFAGALFALGSALDAMGFFGKKSSEYEVLDKRLKEIYSPIHVAIVGVRNQLRVQGTTTGQLLYVGIAPDYEGLSQIFRQYVHVLGDHHLTMWLSIEKEIRANTMTKGVGGFFLDKARQTWLDELDTEYENLVKELKKLKGKP